MSDGKSLTLVYLTFMVLNGAASSYKLKWKTRISFQTNIWPRLSIFCTHAQAHTQTHTHTHIHNTHTCVHTHMYGDTHAHQHGVCTHTCIYIQIIHVAYIN